MRLIDANELKKEIASAFHGTLGLTVTSAVHEIIDRQPAIAAPTREQVEKRRSKWIMNNIDNPGFFICEQCESVSNENTNFCPNCGAPMTDEAVDIILQRLEALSGEAKAN